MKYFRCLCDVGYTGEKCDVEVNECLSQPCQNQGVCSNGPPGTFICTCAFGKYVHTQLYHERNLCEIT